MQVTVTKEHYDAYAAEAVKPDRQTMICEICAIQQALRPVLGSNNHTVGSYSVFADRASNRRLADLPAEARTLIHRVDEAVLDGNINSQKLVETLLPFTFELELDLG